MSDKETLNGEMRIDWGRTLVRFAKVSWAVATVIGVAILLMMIAYQMAVKESHAVAYGVLQGFIFGAVFATVIEACITTSKK